MSLMLKSAALAVAILGLAPAARAADEPPHTVVLEDGPVQIRDYAAMIMAQVEVNGDMARAGNAGFRPLAGYIFGGNSARDGGNDEIAMTAPVIQTPSQNIDMTAPVTQTMTGTDSWRVSFVMPPEWTMDTLPVPDDPDVTLSEVPARRMAVIRFTGGANDEHFAEKTAQLRTWLSTHGYEVIGEPLYARYDPPWVPTFFRRNEVMLEIAG